MSKIKFKGIIRKTGTSYGVVIPLPLFMANYHVNQTVYVTIEENSHENR